MPRVDGFLAMALISLAAGSAWAAPVFDVATVKQSPPPEGDRININLGRVLNGKLTFANASLSDCLKFAYRIVSNEQLVGPDWITSKAVRFDIVAQAPPDTPRDQIELMLRALLAERLQVAVHHETRELPYLALTVTGSGAKLHAGKGPGAGNSARRGHIAGNDMSMLGLATLLSRFEQQTILDRTGLNGQFEVNLDWTPNNGIHPDEQGGPSLFTAIEEQLGLRLQSRKGPLDVLVIDHAEKVPAAN